MKSRFALYVADGGMQILELTGREEWALSQLIAAGDRGCTPIDTPGPRWSDYTFKLRRRGINVETITEAHGGPYGASTRRRRSRTVLTAGRPVGWQPPSCYSSSRARPSSARKRTPTATVAPSPFAERLVRIWAPSWSARGWPGRSSGTAETTLTRRPWRRAIGSACTLTTACRLGTGERN